MATKKAPFKSVHPRSFHGKMGPIYITPFIFQHTINAREVFSKLHKFDKLSQSAQLSIKMWLKVKYSNGTDGNSVQHFPENNVR